MAVVIEAHEKKNLSNSDAENIKAVEVAKVYRFWKNANVLERTKIVGFKQSISRYKRL